MRLSPGLDHVDLRLSPSAVRGGDLQIDHLLQTCGAKNKRIGSVTRSRSPPLPHPGAPPNPVPRGSQGHNGRAPRSVRAQVARAARGCPPKSCRRRSVLSVLSVGGLAAHTYNPTDRPVMGGRGCTGAGSRCVFHSDVSPNIHKPSACVGARGSLCGSRLCGCVSCCVRGPVARERVGARWPAPTPEGLVHTRAAHRTCRARY